MERSPESVPEKVVDELLVLEAQGGDARALGQLVERWQLRVLRHALTLTGRRDLAADVAQESWIAVAKGLRRLDDPACFGRWLLRIVSHKSVDAIRQAQRQRKLAEHVAAEAPQATGPTDRDETDDVSALQRAIARLPGDERALVSMFYWDQRSLAEIAHILNIPLGTVKSRLYYVRQELKQILERSKP
jgi:RNA polymerase sigma-70 factor (ECF subfamily)